MAGLAKEWCNAFLSDICQMASRHACTQAHSCRLACGGGMGAQELVSTVLILSIVQHGVFTSLRYVGIPRSEWAGIGEGGHALGKCCVCEGHILCGEQGIQPMCGMSDGIEL